MDEMYWRNRERMLAVYEQKPADKRPVWVIQPDGNGAHPVECLRYQMSIDGSHAAWKPLPVFPKTGALPSEFPVIERSQTLPDGVFVITEPRRFGDQVRAISTMIPGGTFVAPADRWQFMPNARRRLETGEELRIVNLGDSIVNDMARSGWMHLLRQRRPNANIPMTTVVRGGTGCWYYKANERGEQILGRILEAFFAPD